MQLARYAGVVVYYDRFRWPRAQTRLPRMPVQAVYSKPISSEWTGTNIRTVFDLVDLAVSSRSSRVRVSYFSGSDRVS